MSLDLESIGTWRDLFLLAFLLGIGFVSVWASTAYDEVIQEDKEEDPEEIDATRPAKKTTSEASSKEGMVHRILWSLWLDTLFVPWYISAIVFVPEWIFPRKDILPLELENRVAETAAFFIFLTGAIWFGKRHTHVEVNKEIIFLPAFIALHAAGIYALGELIYHNHPSW